MLAVIEKGVRTFGRPPKLSRADPLLMTLMYWRESRKRIVIEHIFCKLKVLRILSEKYRNRRKRFALRFNLTASIYNSA